MVAVAMSPWLPPRLHEAFFHSCATRGLVRAVVTGVVEEPRLVVPNCGRPEELLVEPVRGVARTSAARRRWIRASRERRIAGDEREDVAVHRAEDTVVDVSRRRPIGLLAGARAKPVIGDEAPVLVLLVDLEHAWSARRPDRVVPVERVLRPVGSAGSRVTRSAVRDTHVLQVVKHKVRSLRERRVPFRHWVVRSLSYV
jgi:hypothetical protein